MLTDGNKLAGLILTLITMMETGFASVISVIIIMLIIFYYRYNRIKRADKTILLLCFNIYFCCLTYMLLFFVLIIQSAVGDVYHKEFDSLWCRLIAYIYAAALFVLYMSFVNQALFRLCRIVYPQYKYLQASCLYIIIFILEVILAFILLCPTYVWNDIIYLPNDHFCFVPISNVRGYLWIFLSVYGVPILSIFLIYVRISMFIRKQSTQPSRSRRRLNQDLSAIRGIFIIVGFLLSLGLPTAFLIIMMFITGHEHPLTFRITCASIGTSMAGLNTAMIHYLPQLRIMVRKTFKKL